MVQCVGAMLVTVCAASSFLSQPMVGLAHLFPVLVRHLVPVAPEGFNAVASWPDAWFYPFRSILSPL
jgi:hypothetical protein